MTRRLTRTRRRLKNRSKHSRSKRGHSRNNKYKKTRCVKYIKKRRRITLRRVLRGGLDYDDEFDKFKKADQLRIQHYEYNFFHNLKISLFDKALCELYKLYKYKIDGVENVFEIIIRRSSFQNRYHRLVFSSRPFRNTFTRITTSETLPNRILPQFLAYILSKIGEGGYILCNGKELYFIAVKSDERSDTLIYMLQELFDALDFVGSSHGSNTISYAMHDDSVGKHQGDKAFDSLLDVLNKLKDYRRIDGKTRAQIEDILTHIMIPQSNGSTVYVINTSIFNRLIKLLFGKIDDEDDSLSSILASSQESIEKVD